jgi:tRNA(fMet)-specific endonuclease VapC
MEEAVYDTNQLIDFLKKGKVDLAGFTTIFNLVEFPKALEFEQLTVIYPDIDDYQESVEISTALLHRGKPLPAVDIMVAAICIRRNLTLYTKDGHFSAIKTVRKDFKLQFGEEK